MAIGVGEKRELYRPLNHEGNYSADAKGCHRGHMSVLNVVNSKPGFRYWYSRTDPSSIRRAVAFGWQPVSMQDPERMGEEQQPDLVAAGLDTSLSRNDIVLCRMPEARYRERRKNLDELAEGQRTDSAAEYLEKGRPLQETYGEAVYFRGPGHGFRHSE